MNYIAGVAVGVGEAAGEVEGFGVAPFLKPVITTTSYVVGAEVVEVTF